METDSDILLVEDHLQDELSVKHALKQDSMTHGMQVVHDAAEAWEYLTCAGAHCERKMENPKLILVDLQPPAASGIQLLRKIRSSQYTRYIPVVFLTASDNQRDMLQSYGFGVNSYIIKPTLPEELTGLVKEVGYYWLQVNRQPDFAQLTSLTAASSLERD